MEPTRFDALSRALGRPHSRRTALALLTAGRLALRGTPEAAARHEKKHPCKGQPDDTPRQGDGRCLSGVCQSEPTCLPSDTDSTTNQTGCCSHLCKSKSSGSPYQRLHCDRVERMSRKTLARSRIGPGVRKRDPCNRGLIMRRRRHSATRSAGFDHVRPPQRATV